MRRIIRGSLWLIKAALLVFTLAVFAIWPMSYGHRRGVALSKVMLMSDRMEMIKFGVTWGKGRLEAGEQRQEYLDEGLDFGRSLAATHGAGWRWTVESGKSLVVVHPNPVLGPIPRLANSNSSNSPAASSFQR